MARLFYGLGRGFKNKSGFTDSDNPKSFNTEIVRPPFSINGSQFIRDTAALNDTPMPFGAEGNVDYDVETAAAVDTISISSFAIGGIISESVTAVDSWTVSQSIDGNLDWPEFDWNVVAAATVGNVVSGALIWPEINVTAYTGGEGSLTWPDWTMTAQASSGAMVSGSLIWPDITVSGVFTQENLLAGALIWPDWIVSSALKSGLTAQGRLILDQWALQGSLLGGVTAEGALRWPDMNVDGTLLSGSSIVGVVIWPDMNVDGTALPGYYADGVLIWPDWTVTGELSEGSIITGALIWPDWTLDGILSAMAALPVITCYVMNVNNRALSRYTGYPFVGFARFKDRYLATDRATGLFELTGDTDNGAEIVGTMKFRLEDMDADGRKHKIREVWVTSRTAGDLEASLQEEEMRIIPLHKMETIKKGSLYEIRFKAPRGLRGRFYSLILTGANKYDLNSVRMMDDNLPERVR